MEHRKYQTVRMNAIRKLQRLVADLRALPEAATVHLVDGSGDPLEPAQPAEIIRETVCRIAELRCFSIADIARLARSGNLRDDIVIVETVDGI